MRCKHERVTVYCPGIPSRAVEILDGTIVYEYQHGRSGRRFIVQCRNCGLERTIPSGKSKPPRWAEAALALVS